MDERPDTGNTTQKGEGVLYSRNQEHRRGVQLPPNYAGNTFDIQSGEPRGWDSVKRHAPVESDMERQTELPETEKRMENVENRGMLRSTGDMRRSVEEEHSTEEQHRFPSPQFSQPEIQPESNELPPSKPAPAMWEGLPPAGSSAVTERPAEPWRQLFAGLFRHMGREEWLLLLLLLLLLTDGCTEWDVLGLLVLLLAVR